MFFTPLKGGASLSFDGGLTFSFQAYDAESAQILNHLSNTMHMHRDRQSKPDTLIQIKKGSADPNRVPFVMHISASRGLHAAAVDLLTAAEGPVSVYVDSTFCKEDTAFYYLWQLSLPIVHRVELEGGLLLHGALIIKDGYGIILAGPSEAGKTTASMRIPYPWQTLSDDCTLLVKTEGGYMAHPWPTWSRFLFQQGGGTWEIEKAVPLRGIFFLRKSEDDGIEEIIRAQAMCMLIESTEQASAPPEWLEQIENIRTLRMRRLNNLCALAQSIPSFLLSVSREGSFWELIEKSVEQACIEN